MSYALIVREERVMLLGGGEMPDGTRVDFAREMKPDETLNGISINRYPIGVHEIPDEEVVKLVGR